MRPLNVTLLNRLVHWVAADLAPRLDRRTTGNNCTDFTHSSMGGAESMSMASKWHLTIIHTAAWVPKGDTVNHDAGYLG